jgi:hypothetical protein
MNYPDGQLVRLGDKVKLWEGCEGIVVCSIDTNEFSDNYPASQWEYLKVGVLIDSSQAGLIHYLEPESAFQLIEREAAAEAGQ